MADADDDLRDDEKPEGEVEKKRLIERALERAVPEIFKRAVERAVETGMDRLSEGPENLRQFVGDLKLPKELLQHLYGQIDETKSGLYRVVAKEIRDVLEQTNLADEISKVLTKLSFEIKTEIRFIPNEAAIRKEEASGDEPPKSSGLPKPEVNAQVTVKDRSKEAGRERRREEK
ncbi:hypothetical protein [Chondromyces apiculatus]|uniref:Uncharacterized protein n=1 Tax=Chondromyces apiculatus DSM 436 TaxID=1192034 RepID=A0A017TFF8_9BACT|nr:hypothetical protein [Chondromyces apiculatus]EYF08018.1 Hypothetical protein CAP_7040 [Chondromyces apiculatus DSM 436]